MENIPTDIVYSCSGLEPKRPKECKTNPYRYFIFMNTDEIMEYFNNKRKDNDDEI